MLTAGRPTAPAARRLVEAIVPEADKLSIYVDVSAGTVRASGSRSRRAKTASPSPKEDRLLRFTIDVPDDDPLAVMVEERMPGLPGHLLPPGAPPRMRGTGMTVSADVLRFY